MYIAKTKISYPITLSSDELLIKRLLDYYVTETEDETLIDSQLKSACANREGFINQDIAYTSNAIILKEFTGGELVIPQGNFNAITSIVNNDSSTSITAYTTTKSYDNVIVSFDPTLDTESLTIKFTTGFADIDEVPTDLKHSIILKAKGLLLQTNSFDETCDALAMPYKLL